MTGNLWQNVAALWFFFSKKSVMKGQQLKCSPAVQSHTKESLCKAALFCFLPCPESVNLMQIPDRIPPTESG